MDCNLFLEYVIRAFHTALQPNYFNKFNNNEVILKKCLICLPYPVPNESISLECGDVVISWSCVILW